MTSSPSYTTVAGTFPSTIRQKRQSFTGPENSDVDAAAVVAVVVTYLVSSISAPWLIARLYGVDLRTAGSRKLGGSNLMKNGGGAPGAYGRGVAAVQSFHAVLR